MHSLQLFAFQGASEFKHLPLQRRRESFDMSELHLVTLPWQLTFGESLAKDSLIY